jgi:hypothetical protein
MRRIVDSHYSIIKTPIRGSQLDTTGIYTALTVRFGSFHSALFPIHSEEWARLLFKLLTGTSMIELGVDRRTAEFVRDAKGFCRRLKFELADAFKQSVACGTQLIVRLNEYSDIPWEEPVFGCIPQSFPSVLFVDDTDDHRRVGCVSPNYYLFYRINRSVQSVRRAAAILDSGFCASMLVTQSERQFVSTEDFARHYVGAWAGERGVSLGGRLYSGFDGSKCLLSRLVVARHARNIGCGAVAIIRSRQVSFLEENRARLCGLVIPLSNE